jgi:hypothetical protein
MMKNCLTKMSWNLINLVLNKKMVQHIFDNWDDYMLLEQYTFSVMQESRLLFKTYPDYDADGYPNYQA